MSRLVAGLWCEDVLARLSEYLDAELDPTERARVEEHLRGCDGCARFGGEMSATLRALRDHLGGAVGELPAAVLARLREALRRG